MADEPEEPQNPFKGTPFEQFFSAWPGWPGWAARGMPDLNQLFGQLQSMLQPYDGPLNWDVALDLARKTVAQSARPDAQPGPAGRRRRRGPAGRPLARRDHVVPLRRDHRVRLEPGRVGRRHHRRVEGAGRARRRSPSAPSARALPEEAQAQAGPILGILGRPSARCSPTRSAPASARWPARCSRVSDIGAALWPRPARPRSSRPTSPPSPRGSTSARTTCCSTSRCARPPTSGSSPTSRGCAST